MACCRTSRDRASCVAIDEQELKARFLCFLCFLPHASTHGQRATAQAYPGTTFDQSPRTGTDVPQACRCRIRPCSTGTGRRYN
jgi:hypothetical protein